MSNWERAMLYLIRKKNKSIILLAILTVIATLVLTCISIGNATETASRNLRESIGGYFKIVSNTDQGYTKPVDDNLVQAVMESEGVKSYNGLDTNYMLTEALSLTPGRFTMSNDPKAKLARFIGNTNSGLNEYFILHSFTLTEGRHITPDDIGKALISSELALHNDLTLGDTFTAMPNIEELPEKLQNTPIQPYIFEIIGIYDINTTQNSSGADTAECDIADNFIFVDTASIRAINEPLIGKKIDAYQNGAAFFVTDPQELDNITSQLTALGQYDWDGYKITKNNEAYNRSAAPLARMSSLLTTIIIALGLISIILLSLILVMWMRDRVHEIGILLSIGLKKSSIINQHIIENLLIASLALILAWGIGNVTADKIGGLLFSNIQEEPTAVSNDQTGYHSDVIDASEIQTDSLIKISVGPFEFLEVVGIGFLIVIISTGFSSILVLNMKPKDILSTMS